MSKTASDRASWDLDIAVRPDGSPDVHKAALARWFEGRFLSQRDLRVVSLGRPVANGGSSTTLFVTLESGEDPSFRREYVLRSKPTAFRLFLRDNFEAQYRLLEMLETQSDVPVPAMHAYEADPSIIGAPFFVMEKVAGEVPPDAPSYHMAGFLFEATPEQRRRTWASGLEVVARIARVDPDALPPLVPLAPGESGADEQLRHWGESLDWATGGSPPPLLVEVYAWLLANRPTRLRSHLSWGDARIGNMIFRDFTCVAAIDWETVTLADPQLDLAHWLLMDAFWAKYLGVVPLAGFGERAETIATWERLTGCVADSLDWHEILASFRLCVIQERVRALRGEGARSAGIIDSNGDTIAIRQLRDILARCRPAA